MSRARWVPSVLGPLLLVGCGDVVAQPIGLAHGGDASVDGTPLADAASEAEAQADASFCAGHGPIPLPGASACVGDLADVFRFAACACASLDVSGTLTTDSFDGVSDAGPAGLDLASVASNGEISTNSTTSVGGSLWAEAPSTPGAPAVTLRGSGTIAHDLRSGASVEVGGKFLVEGDVWANGDVALDTGASLAVVGSVHIPQGSTATGVQGSVVSGPVQIAAPCDCASPIDVPAIVAAFASANDDASIGLSPGATLGGAVSLPCGRYYVAAIDGASVALLVNGRVALFVDGDLTVTQELRVELAPAAELDLFVKGSVSIQGSLAIGQAAQAARTRLYVGGATVSLSATASPFAANVYAPNATLQLASNLEMWGALFAHAMQFSGNFAIHYDTSVLQVSQTAGCAPTGGSCRTCSDCGGATPACVAGTCAPCATSADCCAPLGCDPRGRCVLAAQ